jgi:hypothetical protein
MRTKSGRSRPFASKWPSFARYVQRLRQPCFAQAVKEMLVVIGILELRKPPRRARERMIGLNPQDLGRLHASPFHLAQLCIGHSQADMACAQVGCSRDNRAGPTMLAHTP